MKDVEGALPQLLLGRDNNIISKGLGQLCEEFTLAEDILLVTCLPVSYCFFLFNVLVLFFFQFFFSLMRMYFHVFFLLLFFIYPVSRRSDK